MCKISGHEMHIRRFRKQILLLRLRPNERIDFRALLQQLRRDIAPDESGRPGDHDYLIFDRHYVLLVYHYLTCCFFSFGFVSYFSLNPAF
jgi:hypothetical protein